VPGKKPPAPTFAQQRSFNDELADRYSAFVDQRTGMSQADFEASEAAAQRARDEEERNRPGMLEAGVRGGVQGLTLGFGDEIGGLLKSAFTSKSYKEARDEIRANNQRAQEAEPIAYGIGDILGSVVPGVATAGASAAVGTAARAVPTLARLASPAVRGALAGAAEGAVSGVGYSEADEIGDILKDAAVGAGVGGATGAIAGKLADKALSGAEARRAEHIVEDVTGGKSSVAAKKVMASDDLVAEAAEKFKLDTSAEPRELLQAAKAARKDVGEQLGAAYKTMGDEALGASLADVRQAVGNVKRAYGSPSDAPLRKRLESYLDDVAERWTEKRVPLEQLNAEIGKLEKVGFAGAELSPAAGKQLKRDLASALEDVLQNRLDEIKSLGADVGAGPLAKRPAFAGIPAAAEAAEKLSGLNRDYRGLRLIVDAAKDRASEGARKGQGWTDRLSLGLGAAAGGPLGAAKAAAINAGGRLAVAGAKKADRAITAALARVVRGAREGKVTQQLVLEAIKVGVPMPSITAALGLYHQAMPGGISADE
jgi:hypothetical protein